MLEPDGLQHGFDFAGRSLDDDKIDPGPTSNLTKTWPYTSVVGMSSYLSFDVCQLHTHIWISDLQQPFIPMSILRDAMSPAL